MRRITTRILINSPITRSTMSRSRPTIDVSAHLVEPLQQFDAAPIQWAELFGNENPIEIEIGSGKGLFLVNAAMANPGRNFLGVELSRKYARLAAARLARCQLSNAKVWRGDAGVVMARLVPRESIRALHVYFPDPWWKTRHKKRRVFTAELVASAERALQPGGALRIASDVQEYFGVIRGLIGSNHRFREQRVALPKEPEHDLDYLTSFERKYRLQGRPIHRAEYLLGPAVGDGELREFPP
jgi:tRNA (guanine-N7-)-methyltransferase